MHSLCIVAGGDPAAALARFADQLKVERYKRYLEPSLVSAMARQCGADEDDLPALVPRLPDWAGAEGGIDGDRLFVWSTENPHGKYDWYRVGGRFRDYFRLKAPRPPTRWQRLTGRTDGDRADRARKGEVDLAVVLADPPAALLADGEWHECPLARDTGAAWAAEVRMLLETLPDDVLLTAVDLHS